MRTQDYRIHLIGGRTLHVREECDGPVQTFLQDMKRAATNQVDTILLLSHLLTFLFDRYMRWCHIVPTAKLHCDPERRYQHD